MKDNNPVKKLAYAVNVKNKIRIPSIKWISQQIEDVAYRYLQVLQETYKHCNNCNKKRKMGKRHINYKQTISGHNTLMTYSIGDCANKITPTDNPDNIPPFCSKRTMPKIGIENLDVICEYENLHKRLVKILSYLEKRSKIV